jgi:hypothetical protein
MLLNMMLMLEDMDVIQVIQRLVKLYCVCGP